jgi:uroporphyrin-III C-methyltransferase/precorrin-2 dehydrogenase/sirohydrochlorin ferrochelatase
MAAPPLHSLPIFVRLQGRHVILVGEGEAAEPKRRLLERAGAIVVTEDAPAARTAALAIVADDPAAVARLRARGVLVNAVDRPDLCDFTLPAIVDRAPVIVAIGTGGVSAGLAAAVRQRLEVLLPERLGALADALFAARGWLRARFPDGGDRRRAIAAALAPGAALDPLADHAIVDVPAMLDDAPAGRVERVRLASADPDALTLRQARLLATADRVTHRADVPRAILDRARADAPRTLTAAPPADDAAAGLTIDVELS